MEYTICDEKDFQSSQIWNIRTNNLFRSLGHSAKHQIYTKIYITINKLFVVEDILIYPQIIRECSTPRTRAPTCRHTHTNFKRFLVDSRWWLRSAAYPLWRVLAMFDVNANGLSKEKMNKEKFHFIAFGEAVAMTRKEQKDKPPSHMYNLLDGQRRTRETKRKRQRSATTNYMQFFFWKKTIVCVGNMP